MGGDAVEFASWVTLRRRGANRDEDRVPFDGRRGLFRFYLVRFNDLVTFSNMERVLAISGGFPYTSTATGSGRSVGGVSLNG